MGERDLCGCLRRTAGLAASTSLEEGEKEKDQGSSLESVSVGSLRDKILHDVADGLLEHHDDSHLDEEVSDAAAGVALEGTTRQVVPCKQGGWAQGTLWQVLWEKAELPRGSLGTRERKRRSCLWGQRMGASPPPASSGQRCARSALDGH